MSTPYVGEIRMFASNFAPLGWAFCDGRTLSIAENEVLYQLIGTTYGGDGVNTFALPNLQSRIPVHPGPGFVLGQLGGAESVTLTTNQIPAHSHLVMATANPGTTATSAAVNDVLADESVASMPTPPVYSYAAFGGNQRTFNPAAIANAGGGQPHDNMAPFLVINFIISLFGIFPSQ